VSETKVCFLAKKKKHPSFWNSKIYFKALSEKNGKTSPQNTLIMTDILTKRNRHPLYGNRMNARPSGNIGNKVKI